MSNYSGLVDELALFISQKLFQLGPILLTPRMVTDLAEALVKEGYGRVQHFTYHDYMDEVMAERQPNTPPDLAEALIQEGYIKTIYPGDYTELSADFTHEQPVLSEASDWSPDDLTDRELEYYRG